MKNSWSLLYFVINKGDILESIQVSNVLSSPTNSFFPHFLQLSNGGFSFQGLTYLPGLGKFASLQDLQYHTGTSVALYRLLDMGQSSEIASIQSINLLRCYSGWKFNVLAISNNSSLYSICLT